jgi:hypothetical protein
MIHHITKKINLVTFVIQNEQLRRFLESHHVEIYYISGAKHSFEIKPNINNIFSFPM